MSVLQSENDVLLPPPQHQQQVIPSSTFDGGYGYNNGGDDNYEYDYDVEDIPIMPTQIITTSIPYDIGFLFFMTMTMLLGCTIAIHWSTWIRRNDISNYVNHPNYINNERVRNNYYGSWSRHVCNILNILVLEACIALLTWSSIQGPVEDILNDLQYEREGPYSIIDSEISNDRINEIGQNFLDVVRNGRLGFMIAILLLWIPLLSVSGFLMTKYSLRRVLLIMSTLLLIIPGTVIIAFVCNQMSSLQVYTYHGPMRITNVTVTATNHTTLLHDTISTSVGDVKSYRNAYVSYFHGAIEVSWGYDWGCPKSPTTTTSSSPIIKIDTWCDTLVYYKPCSFCQIVDESNPGTNFCQHPNYYRGTYDDTEQCIIKQYNLRDITNFDILEASKYDMIYSPHKTFDRSVEPTNDRDWPNETFYGDCTTCQARSELSYETHRLYVGRLQQLGVTLTCIGVVIHMIIMLWQTIPNFINNLMLLFLLVITARNNGNNPSAIPSAQHNHSATTEDPSSTTNVDDAAARHASSSQSNNNNLGTLKEDDEDSDDLECRSSSQSNNQDIREEKAAAEEEEEQEDIGDLECRVTSQDNNQDTTEEKEVQDIEDLECRLTSQDSIPEEKLEEGDTDDTEPRVPSQDNNQDTLQEEKEEEV